MFAVVGVAAILLLAVAAVGIFYIAGSRGKGQEKADHEIAAKGLGQKQPQPPRAEGRGDL